MKKAVLFSVLVFTVFLAGSCNKDKNDKQLNTITINEGEFKDFSHTFSPNLGFWSQADETTKSVHLVLGDVNNQTDFAENVMSIYFYYTGAPEVQFPSAEGQWIHMGLNIDGTVYYMTAESATLTIANLSDFQFDGTLSVKFVDQSDNTRNFNATVNLSLAMQEI